jgi:hypothetical protein
MLFKAPHEYGTYIPMLGGLGLMVYQKQEQTPSGCQGDWALRFITMVLK